MSSDPLKNRRKTIAIVVPPSAQSLDISGPVDAFLEAEKQSAGAASYDIKLLSMTTELCVQAGGMSILTDHLFGDFTAPIDTLLVAGTPDYRCALEMPEFTDWLKQAAPNAHRYGSVCTGAFFLGAAGLLDGRQATTHWRQAAELAARYPKATIMPDAIYIRDGELYTSAGVTAGIDLALRLIEDDHGRELALKIARQLVVFLRRPGGQSQFSAHLAAQMASESRVQAIQRWILENVEKELMLPALASQMAMSVRNFSRVFQTETGITPTDFVELARVDAARRLLEDSDEPLQRIAPQCGFTNADIMRRAFIRRIGIGPSDYRARFRY